MGKFGFKKAFTYKNITFFGGTATNLARSMPFDMILNLSGQTELFEEEAHEVFKNYNAVNAQAEDTPRLDIDWPDYGLPKLSPAAWDGLVLDIQEFCKDKNKKYEVAALCVGGHGRTGTTLAILKSLLLKDKGDPVLSIRKCYDGKAVETYGQIQYVSFVTGKKSKAKPVPVNTFTNKPATSPTLPPTSPGFKPLPSTLAAAKAAKVEVCKHWEDNVGTKMKDCDDCDKLIDWIKTRAAEKAADKYVSTSLTVTHADHVQDENPDPTCNFCKITASHHDNHKVFVSTCLECVKEDDEETEKIMTQYAGRTGQIDTIEKAKEFAKVTDLVPIKNGYVEVSAEVVADILKKGFATKH